MERTEVCLVEAKQFENGDLRVVVPTLWGYTEQARRIKKTVTVQKSGARRVWNAESFREDALRRLDPTAAQQVLGLYEFCRKLPNAELKWGSGKDRGSFSVVNRSVSQKSLITVLSDGELWLNFNWLNQSDNERSARDSLLRRLSKISSLGINDTQPEKGRIVAVKRWGPVRNELERCLEEASLSHLRSETSGTSVGRLAQIAADLKK